MAGDERQDGLARVYGGPDGKLRFDDFFDLIAVHEVAHLFCEGQVAFPRMWLGELFANLALHAWVAQQAPDSLDTLTTLPRLAAQGSGVEFEHRSRDDFERLYSSVGGPNYVWYQFRLQVAAANSMTSSARSRCGGCSMRSASTVALIAIPRHSTSRSTTRRLPRGSRRPWTRSSAPSRWCSETGRLGASRWRSRCHQPEVVVGQA